MYFCTWSTHCDGQEFPDTSCSPAYFECVLYFSVVEIYYCSFFDECSVLQFYILYISQHSGDYGYASLFYLIWTYLVFKVFGLVNM